MTAPFTTFPIPTALLDTTTIISTGSSASRSLADRWADMINVKDFGAKGDGVTDDTAAIQAAIDYAYHHQHQTIYLPAGNYKTSSSLYLDAPGTNWRHPGGPQSNTSQFSMSLQGDIGGGANDEPGGTISPPGFGTFIFPTNNNFIVIAVGPGRGMGISNIQIIAPPWAAGSTVNFSGYKGNQDPNGCGVAVMGGCSRTLFENMYVANLYSGFRTGDIVNALADANTWIKCLVSNCYYGFLIGSTQNFVNTLIHCHAGCTVNVSAAAGQDTHIYGGNWSSAGWSYVFPITASSMSAISWGALPGINNGNNVYYFTLTLGAWVGGPDAGGDMPPTVNTIYNAFAMQTAHYGVIPILMSTWNSGTRQAQCYILPQYMYTWMAPFNSNIIASTGLQADMQAVANLHAAERIITFSGGCMNVDGVHIENDVGAGCVFDNTGSTAPRPSVLRNCLFNTAPVPAYGPADGFAITHALYAVYIICMSHPFFNIGSGNSLFVEDCVFPSNADSMPVWIDTVFNAGQVSRLVLNRINGLHRFRAYTQMWGGGGFIQNAYGPTGAGQGVGESDSAQFYLTQDSNLNWYANLGKFLQPYWGVHPAPYTRPVIMPADADAIISGPPPITWTGYPGSMTYPLMWGGQVYAINRPEFSKTSNETEVGRRFYSMVSDHHFYTYGQTINHATCSVSYQSGSNCIYVAPTDNETLNVIFPGLGVIINSNLCIVTGVVSELGYFTVLVYVGGGLVWGGLMPGTPGTNNGPFTTIGQESFSIRRLDIPTRVNYSVPITGFSMTLDNLDTDVILNPAGTLATGTITLMPDSALYDQDKLTIRTSQTISTLTITAGTGSSVVGAPTTLAAGALTTAIYRKANTTWYFAH